MTNAQVNRTLDNQVTVTNYGTDGMVQIDIEHAERRHEARARISPSQARIIADALNICADEIEAEQAALAGRLSYVDAIDVESWECTYIEHHVIALGPPR